jgi:hypothetical protein
MCGASLQLGDDANGTEMVRQMESAGVKCSAVIQDSKSQTALAVLPIYAATGGKFLSASSSYRAVYSSLLMSAVLQVPSTACDNACGMIGCVSYSATPTASVTSVAACMDLALDQLIS